MKEKFLKLVTSIRDTGVVEEFYRNLTAQGIKTVFNKFKGENQKLIADIEQWKNEYKQGEPHYLFEDGESVEYPMEIAMIIYLMEDLYVTEEELFENLKDLTIEILSIPNDFATAIYILVEYEDCPINEITVPEICRFLKAIEEHMCDANSTNQDFAGEEYGEDEVQTIYLAEAEDH